MKNCFAVLVTSTLISCATQPGYNPKAIVDVGQGRINYVELFDTNLDCRIVGRNEKNIRLDCFGSTIFVNQ